MGNHAIKVTKAMGRRTKSRFALKPLIRRTVELPPFDDPAVVEGRTRYLASLREPASETVLKSAKNQAKIGGLLVKGKWRGMPVYSLTLEERKTCPTDCPLWRGCYGNNMHLAHRFRHGPALERKLRKEVRQLSREHPAGFVVRLHTLGDFYSVEYVQLWAELLKTYPQLRIFGYTARWCRDDSVALALIRLAMENWDRFAMRFSNAPITACSTITIEHMGQKPADAILCPAQVGKTESCSTCGLCWQTDRRIAFLRH